jgi:hypothetical protein
VGWIFVEANVQGSEKTAMAAESDVSRDLRACSPFVFEYTTRAASDRDLRLLWRAESTTVGYRASFHTIVMTLLLSYDEAADPPAYAAVRASEALAVM